MAMSGTVAQKDREHLQDSEFTYNILRWRVIAVLVAVTFSLCLFSSLSFSLPSFSPSHILSLPISPSLTLFLVSLSLFLISLSIPSLLFPSLYLFPLSYSPLFIFSLSLIASPLSLSPISPSSFSLFLFSLTFFILSLSTSSLSLLPSLSLFLPFLSFISSPPLSISRLFSHQSRFHTNPICCFSDKLYSELHSLPNTTCGKKAFRASSIPVGTCG